MKQEEKYYAYWLNSLPGIGKKTIVKLLSSFGSPKQIYEASEEGLKQILNEQQMEKLKAVKATWKLKEAYDVLEKQGISFVWQGAKEYPERLHHIPDAPFALFFKGRLPKDDVLSVAIIGARDCSRYGSYVAAELGKYLGEQGIQVISGMARGIDGISQGAALEAGGVSFGVLGCGVDICYPATNRWLYEKLLRQGGVLSSYPPGAAPIPRNFPPRNRIVSGICDAVVVIEARNRSGTLITVDMALEQGKEVYVVPGRVTDRLSDGCNQLLKQGAGVFLSPQDFLEELLQLDGMRRGELCDTGDASKTVCEISGLSKKMQCVYKLLDFSPQSIDEISKKLSLSISAVEVATVLMRLCMEGYAVQVSPGQFCVRRK